MKIFESASRVKLWSSMRRSLVIGIVTAGLALFGGLGSGLTAAATPTPTPTHLFTLPRIPTRTPAWTPTPTMPSLIANLRKQLSWGGAGGGFSDPGMSQFECYSDLVIPKTTPAIIPIPRKADDFGGLCLVGFTLGKPLTIQFTSPDHGTTITGVFRRGEQITTEQNYLIEQVQPDIGDLAAGAWSLNPQGIPIALIIAWMPLGLPEGRWTVEARNGEQTARAILDTTWPKGAPRLGWRYPKPSILGRPPAVNIYARDRLQQHPHGRDDPYFWLRRLNLSALSRSGCTRWPQVQNSGRRPAHRPIAAAICLLISRPIHSHRPVIMLSWQD